MSASLSSHSYSQVVGVLRSAGCVYAEEEARLLLDAATDEADLSDMVRRRAAGQPIEHVVGWAEFCGLRIAVDPGVFVPRRRSEFLIREAARLPRPASVPVVVYLLNGVLSAAKSIVPSVRQIADVAAAGSKDLDADWVSLKCGNYNKVTKKCGGTS